MERIQLIVPHRAGLVILILWLLLFLSVEALGYSYDVTERMVPWGDDSGEAWTDFFVFDWSTAWADEPWYTSAWGAYNSSAYIYDFNPETQQASLIGVNMDTGAISEDPVEFHSYMGIVPETLSIIYGGNEFFIMESGGHYSCYDYQLNVIWDFTLPWVSTDYGIWSDMYKLNYNLWGVVMVNRNTGHGNPPEYELWKVDSAGELIERVPLHPPDPEGGWVFAVSMDGEVTWDEYVDLYGGVFKHGGIGFMTRDEGGQLYGFDWDGGPENFMYAPWWKVKPFFDATVYSFEYTVDGIRLKRYEYIP